METTSRTGGTAGADRTAEDPRAVDGYLMAAFPWYGLDEAFTGPRWLLRVGVTADGTVEHGSLGHGDTPTLKSSVPMGDPAPDARRFAVVVTLARRPVRPSPDGSGVLEATTAASAAWLAGAGLLSSTWPLRMARGLRQAWVDQQTAIAWELADALDGPEWSSLTLPVDGAPVPFRYRESEYGWVVAGSARGVHLGAYGRGMSPYGLGFAVVRDITGYGTPGAVRGAAARQG
ncbi:MULTISPECIES: hypothetical protein [Streptomycetaceae]|uniref:Uncharacterized protein n=1 Tax=Streptantibioticus cattleyicolor (strain ATCC 35852 / DSM 46488 / JCM 4925 / NBRC 14057 / NRRL 8057) TaxID=1003195 RepID=F8K3P0_STREN|nr:MULTISPECIES: hypothetical protein [Streptomycetaceae]AEW96364.1 hypothetical protein SCATT_39930 [Streptantibioticus cattleyicolor NRRL 8057 = DSM 46488]MYS60878.1 hypothetical protein [Streptomyces sp. SID5468]CCB76704.1 conserved protein of unknown function [Streptantibioticus cattleyicolor NRRL 8057 = DSM 46488]